MLKNDSSVEDNDRARLRIFNYSFNINFNEDYYAVIITIIIETNNLNFICFKFCMLSDPLHDLTVERKLNVHCFICRHLMTQRSARVCNEK